MLVVRRLFRGRKSSGERIGGLLSHVFVGTDSDSVCSSIGVSSMFMMVFGVVNSCCCCWRRFDNDVLLFMAYSSADLFIGPSSNNK
jgi:hypothetical protein